ncbi:MAG: RluA family pseudouridine synthase [Eggerthellales bacterium]|nr:RluA family pseudouridine synthase [Eggerthellales bacterium]
MRMLRYIAGPDCEGQDVNYVLRTCMGLSHASVRRAKFVQGALTLDGEPCWTVAKVSPGQEVAIAIDDQDVEGAAPSVAPQEPVCGLLQIAYEDDDLLMVNKPAGLVMYPGPGHPEGTLGNYVMHHLASRGISCGLHPVQRLDQGTSGLVVFATSSLAKDMLQRQLHTQRFQRGYVAVCEGVPSPAEGVIDAPWAQLSSHPNTFGVSAEGKPAVTHYRTLGSQDGVSAVALRLETGRTHQIRIHMAHIGCPLVGDATYGCADSAGAKSAIDRPALHSFHISLRHPFTGEDISVQAPIPPDMQALLPEILSGDMQVVLP